MMKKLAVAIAIASIAATATVAFAGITPKTGINGSKHDINAVAGYDDDTLKRTCVFCHTPHNVTVQDLAPLWNRAASAKTAVDMPSYTWISPANAAIAFDADPLVGPSRLCMSCHDGVVAVDSHGGASPMLQATGTPMSGAAMISDLTITHPIGFKYADAVTERPGELVLPTVGFIATGVDSASTFDTNDRTGFTYTSKTIGDTLYGGNMTCASCHDVHNTINAEPDTAGAYNYFLYAKQEGSAICLSCHIK